MRLLALAAEEEVDLNPFLPEFGLYVWTLIAFAVVFFVLAKYVFPRLQDSLSDRERRIREDLEEAERTKVEAENALDEYKSKIAQAREESNRIVEEARQSADNVRKEMMAKAEAESRLILDKAQKELAGERDRAMQVLQTQLAQWSTEIAGRIVEKELDAASQTKLVDSFIKELQKDKAAS